MDYLISLVLYANRLTGTIPPELGNLTNLTNLSLNDNRLTGEMPSELGNLEYLNWLSFGGNQLTGCVPRTVRGQAQSIDDCAAIAFLQAVARFTAARTSGTGPDCC